MLPFSEACERNKDPILAILRDALAPHRQVLEIGSGTGQHAVWFARHLPQLTWQPTDRAAELPGLRDRIAAEGAPNLLPPVELDVLASPWPTVTADAVFSANTLHIIGWPGVEAFFAGVAAVLTTPGATLAVYGPFRYGGDYTSPSNAAFDQWLRRRDPASRIRDAEAVDALARAAGLTLEADHAMPANNQLRVWRRRAGSG
jgi:cyclopropane fatty-acyl-phospholipid synthase-like methyltransferase